MKKQMKNNVSILEYMYSNEKNTEKKGLIKELYEKFKYSDPLSPSEEVYKMDEQLYEMIDSLSNRINIISMDELKNENETILNLLNKRNVICKNSK